MSNRQVITILGATGSIGLSTLDVLARHPRHWQIHALSANTDVEGMLELCRQHRPRHAVMASTEAADRLEKALREEGLETLVDAGTQALEAIASAPEVDVVMAAIVGAAGLLPTLAAARSGKRVLLANKEALVMAGNLFMQTVEDHGATLLPIDSEHNAIFQCMPPGYTCGQEAAGVSRILLTASGGPFRERAPETLRQVTPEEACAHPNWDMGRKISVDSATMMNKGLELIEACWLFHATPDRIEVVIHPQSVIHSMVAYADGSVLAQLGNPDMRTPIAHALAWPERIESGVSPLDLVGVGRLDFMPPDPERFPCLRLAEEAARAGGSASTVLNAANEVAVQAFLDRQIAFTDIPRLIEAVMERMPVIEVDHLDRVLQVDREARERAGAWVQRMGRQPA